MMEVISLFYTKYVLIGFVGTLHFLTLIFLLYLTDRRKGFTLLQNGIRVLFDLEEKFQILPNHHASTKEKL